MNIKKSPLMAGLLTLNAIFGAMVGKAETTPYTITDDDRKAIFEQQTEIATVPVANSGAMISVMKGWSAETDVQTNYVETVVGNDTNLTRVVTSKLWTAPFIVRSGDRSSGFAKAFANLPEIGTIAVNEDNGRMYAFAAGENQNFYQISMGNITATEPVSILGQLKPMATTLGFHSENNETSEKYDTRVDRAIAWTDPNYTDNRDFILIYDKDGGMDTTQIWHRNGVVNFRTEFAGIEPKEVMKGQNVIYYTDGQSMVYISKANPEAGEKSVELVADNKGLGVVGDTLYQAQTDGIYMDGVKQNMWNGENGWKAAGGITHMVGNGSKLFIAYNADATSVEYKDIQLDNGVNVAAVKGATKVEARKDGIYAMVKNQMVRVHD